MAKVLVSIDDELLVRIDARARQFGLSRSAYLTQLAEGDLPKLDARAMRSRAIERARTVIAQAKPLAAVDSTKLVRRMRDERADQLTSRD